MGKENGTVSKRLFVHNVISETFNSIPNSSTIHLVNVSLLEIWINLRLVFTNAILFVLKKKTSTAIQQHEHFLTTFKAPGGWALSAEAGYGAARIAVKADQR